MEETAVVNLDPAILTQLEAYEDYASFYRQIEESVTAFSWLKADTLYHMSQRLGEKSLTQLGKDLEQAKSTVTNYIRVARAFPSDKREPAVSFSGHYQASFADSYDEVNQVFIGENRFNWVKKAAEERLSARKVREGVDAEKAAALLISGGEEASERQEAKDKVTMIKKLLDDLNKAVKRGGTDALDKIRTIYNKIYDQS